ncbi:MAG: hypothetical protein EOO50_14990 [Flavobacterium sp.]|nr:MAG: hypothetical protein EOO50_14990 [Flavobacterium sp.]
MIYSVALHQFGYASGVYSSFRIQLRLSFAYHSSQWERNDSNQHINKSTNQRINESTNQRINESTNQQKKSGTKVPLSLTNKITKIISRGRLRCASVGCCDRDFQYRCFLNPCHGLLLR